MGWKTQIDERGVVTRYRDTDTGECISPQEFERRMQMGQLQYQPAQQAQTMQAMPAQSPMQAMPPGMAGTYSAMSGAQPQGMGTMGGANPGGQMMNAQLGAAQQMMGGQLNAAQNAMGQLSQINQQASAGLASQAPGMPAAPAVPGMAPALASDAGNPLIQPGAKMLTASGQPNMLNQAADNPLPPPTSIGSSPLNNATAGFSPTAGMPVQGKSLRMEGVPGHTDVAGGVNPNYKNHGFLDATSIAILLPTLVLLALIIAAAHKKRLFPWQTIRTFNPPSGLLNPRDYERSYLCPPNLRRHGRLGKRNPSATWTDADGVVLPFGFLARTHLPITIPMGRLPNKNLFLVAPSGSGKTTLMRAIIKALLAKPCVIIALEAKANDPNLDERREGFKYTVLPEAQHAGFDTLYFNPLDAGSIHWNPLDLDPITFGSSIVQDINSLDAEEQHWAERDLGYIAGLAQLLKWGAVQVVGEDDQGAVAEVQALPCNPRGLMKLVNNRRNIVESLRRLKNNPEVDPAELSEMTQTLSSIIRTDSDWDKNIQGVRGRLRMFKNPNIMRVTEYSNVDLKASMHQPTVLIFGAPASLGPDAESLAACFVYQLQQALHTRYGTKSVLPLFAFFDEYQTLNIDLAGRLSAIVRGANGGLTVILQNISQISTGGSDVSTELKTIFSNSAIRVCLHNADETTAAFFSEEIGKHAVVVPGIADHYQATGFGIFPTSWNRIHSQQVVARVDSDSIKRMEKHHALVYLSPAGDPEFGEVKPFMVDLRGIEEIARLHLLHNVQGRRPSPDGGAPQGPGPDGGMPMDGGQPPYDGGGQMPYDGGQPGQPGYDGGQPGYPGYDGGQPGYDAGQIAAYGGNNMPAQGEPAFPLFPGQAPQQAAISYPVPSSVNTGSILHAGNSVDNAPAAAAAAPAARICPTCLKPAGKGKFCIECGAFVGAAVAAATAVGAQQVVTGSVLERDGGAIISTAPPAEQAPPPFPTFVTAAQAEPQPALRKASLFESPQQIADTGSAYSAPTTTQPSILQGSKRQPVTSFNLDPSRIGLPGSPQQQPAGKAAGVEF
ncbi:MAG TPA: type IV secretory system conjugative DNA transfer family protein [Trichormus sp.]|jgi:hypothetical protein